MGALAGASVALLILHDPSATKHADPFILAEAFELTPAEARVAVALSEGKSAAEVAAERMVALGTIRNQIKSLLLKTGAQRQGDLVRLVLSVPLS